MKKVLSLLLCAGLLASLLPAALANGGYADALAALTGEEGYITDETVEAYQSTVVLRHRDAASENGTAYSDYELYLVSDLLSREEGPVQRLLLPSTQLVGDYAPTGRGPDASALCADGKTFTYTYFFDAPLIGGETVYHEAGTYTYAVDTATGETEVNYTDEVPSPPQSPLSGFADVPIGSWYEAGVALCAEKGVMIGTGGVSFSPEKNLSQTECLTLAFRLYDGMRGQEHVIEKDPKVEGRMTLTLADGTVFEGYGQGHGEENCVFRWWFSPMGTRGGLYARVPGWQDEKDYAECLKDQDAWLNSHPEVHDHGVPATLTLNGVTYQGTTDCFMAYAPWIFLFQPEKKTAEEVNAVLYDAVKQKGAPVPWWQDTAYTIAQRDLEDIFDPADFSSAPASRGFFAKLIHAACEGHLDRTNTVTAIPDLPREMDHTMADDYREAVYALYEAGILTGVDSEGTFAADATLTRAEAATMAARALDESLRVKGDIDPAAQQNLSYYSILGSLQTEEGYEEEYTYLHDGAFQLPDGVTTVLRSKPCAGNPDKRDYEFYLVRKEGDPQLLRLTLPSTEVLPDGSAPTTQLPDSIQTIPGPDDPENGVKLTYVYRFQEPLWKRDAMLHDKGAYTYTVDIATGEQSVVLEGLYEQALANLTQPTAIYPFQLEQQLEVPACTIVVGTSGVVYPRAMITLVYKPGSYVGEGEVIFLPLKTGGSVYGTVMPDSITLNEEKTVLTYVYQYDEDHYSVDKTLYPRLAAKAGTYTTTVELVTGSVTEEYTPLN